MKVRSARIRSGGVGWLLVPGLLVIGTIYVIPLGKVAALSIYGSAFSVAAYRAFFEDGIRQIILGRTIWISCCVTLMVLFAGYPLAYLLARSPPRRRAFLLLLVVLPVWVSVLVRSYAWMVILGRNGIVNNTLLSLGLTKAPLHLLYNRFSLYVGMVHIMIPYMVLPLFNTLRQIESRLANASHSLGADPGRAFLLVFLPLSLPGIVAGSSLVFVLSLGFYVTPALLGGLTDTTFVMLIERYVNALRDWEQASAMSVVLLIITALLLVITNPRNEGSRSSERPSKGIRCLFRLLLALSDWLMWIRIIRGPQPGGVATHRWKGDPYSPGWFATVFGWATIAFLILPIVVIMILAFSDAPFLEFPPPGFSLRWFANFIHEHGWLAATRTSVEVASLTMVVATVIGGLASIALVRTSFRGKAFLTSLMLSPMVVPTIVFAIALYFLFARLGLVGTRLGLVLSHVVLALPYVIIVISGALRSIDLRLERAAQILGAPPVVAFLRVTLPAIRPAVLTAALFAFLASFDELVVALFISGTTAETLPKRMWEGIREEIDPTIAAVAALLVAISVLFLVISEVVRSQRTGKAVTLMLASDTGLSRPGVRSHGEC
jgi:putative spermidine/putrescine transport system permease protein